MGLSVNSKICSICVKDRNSVEQALSVLLVEADWKNDFELLRHLREVFYRVVLLHRLCKLIVFVLALLAEILALKELREQDDLGAVRLPLFSRVSPRLRYSHSRLLCSASVPLRLLLFAFYISSCGVSVLLSLCAVYIPALYCSFTFNFLNCSSGTASILVQYTFSDSIFYRILFLSSLWDLLRDTVDISASEKNISGRDRADLSFREHFSEDLRRRLIMIIPKLRHDYPAV